MGRQVAERSGRAGRQRASEVEVQRPKRRNSQLRSAYGRHVGEPAWTRFVRRLHAASPEFGRMWAQHDVASPATYLKIFRHPAHDRLIMTTTSLTVLAAPGTRMVVYTPADEATCAAVASLIAGEGSDARYACWPEHHRLRALAT